MVGTPVMTSAPVMIESVASSSVRSAVISVKESRKPRIGSMNALNDQGPGTSNATKLTTNSTTADHDEHVQRREHRRHVIHRHQADQARHDGDERGKVEPVPPIQLWNVVTTRRVRYRSASK